MLRFFTFSSEKKNTLIKDMLINIVYIIMAPLLMIR